MSEEKKPKSEYGTEFLNETFGDLHSSPEVNSALKRQNRHEISEILNKKTAKIEVYLKRLEEVFGNENEKEKERKLDALKKILHEKFVIKAEDIPDNYFENQRKMARQLGHGNIEITPEIRNQACETLTQDQIGSLDQWLDYFADKDSKNYPSWFKYWAMRSVVNLGKYDKQKGKFERRRKDTVAPFPELNQEILSKILDDVENDLQGKGLKEEHFAYDNPNFAKILQGKSFAKLYAYYAEHFVQASEEELKITAGKWVKYNQGDDYLPLFRSLQGKGTGWCTAGQSTAQAHLKGGDFYVYYSENQAGEAIIPRVAIRMENGHIAEVRGIAERQNTDRYISGVADKKLQEFPDYPQYKKKCSDMLRMNDLENKINQEEEPSVADLRFLYEIDGKIDGFGYQKDPRIEEIQNTRNKKKDYVKIFDCKEEEVAENLDELNENTVVFAGDLDLQGESDINLPKLKFVGGSLNLENSKNASLPQLASVGRNLDLRDSENASLPQLASMGRDLNLSGSKNVSLSQLTSVGGDLDLENSKNANLSQLASVGKDLCWSNCQNAKLPPTLEIKGDIEDNLTYAELYEQISEKK